MGGTSAQMHRKGTIMAKTYTIKANGMEFTAPTQAEAMAMAQEFVKSYAPTSAGKKAENGKGKVKDTAFTKHDGTVVMTTKAQAAAWEKHREGYTDRVANKEANLKAWADKREAYKPSQALIKAIKADRAKITLAIAKEKYGFVGTKPDLQALKNSVCK